MDLWISNEDFHYCSATIKLNWVFAQKALLKDHWAADRWKAKCEYFGDDQNMATANKQWSARLFLIENWQIFDRCRKYRKLRIFMKQVSSNLIDSLHCFRIIQKSVIIASSDLQRIWKPIERGWKWSGAKKAF